MLTLVTALATSVATRSYPIYAQPLSSPAWVAATDGHISGGYSC
jgi:hypothetical protein